MLIGYRDGSKSYLPKIDHELPVTIKSALHSWASLRSIIISIRNLFRFLLRFKK